MVQSMTSNRFLLKKNFDFFWPSLPLFDLQFDPPTEGGSSRFALWVAFFEIYNEYVYDLIQPSFCSKSKKRAALRVCDDGAGNAYKSSGNYKE